MIMGGREGIERMMANPPKGVSVEEEISWRE